MGGGQVLVDMSAKNAFFEVLLILPLSAYSDTDTENPCLYTSGPLISMFPYESLHLTPTATNGNVRNLV